MIRPLIVGAGHNSEHCPEKWKAFKLSASVIDLLHAVDIGYEAFERPLQIPHCLPIRAAAVSH